MLVYSLRFNKINNKNNQLTGVDRLRMDSNKRGVKDKIIEGQTRSSGMRRG